MALSAPPATAAPSATASVVACNRCNRAIGPELLTCAERAAGHCPFSEGQQQGVPMRRSRRWPALPMGAVLGLAGVGLLGLTAWVSPWLSPCTVLSGLLALLFGLSFLYEARGRRRHVVDERRGILFQEGRLGGLLIERLILFRLEELALNAPLPEPGQAPVPVVWLGGPSESLPEAHRREEAVRLLSLLLVLMVARGDLVLSRVRLWRRYLGLRRTDEFREELHLRPGKRMREGVSELEQRLVAGSAVPHRDLNHSPTGRPLHEVIRELFPPEGVESPAEALRSAAQQEAVRRGLARWVRNGTEHYELLPELVERLAADRSALGRLREVLAVRAASLLQQLELEIERGMQAATARPKGSG